MYASTPELIPREDLNLFKLLKPVLGNMHKLPTMGDFKVLETGWF